MALLIRLLFVTAIVFVVYRLLFPARPVSVTLTCDGVTKSKGVSTALLRRIDEFAREEFLPGESIKVDGNYIENGKIRWVFPKNTNVALEQKFRNVLGTLRQQR